MRRYRKWRSEQKRKNISEMYQKNVKLCISCQCELWITDNDLSKYVEEDVVLDTPKTPKEGLTTPYEYVKDYGFFCIICHTKYANS